jgi:hypothetical protein
MPCITSNKIDARSLVHKFNSLFNITAEEYRKELHEIQLSNLRKVSTHIITNHVDTTHKPFSHIQAKAFEELMAIADDDIIIPMDDDDWISPEVLNFNFIDGLSGWSCGVINTKNFAKLSLQLENVLFKDPDNLTCSELSALDKGLLSNCQAFSGRMIKRLLPCDDGRRLLQHHTMCRKIARAHNFPEYITNQRLAIYVKHACNITLLDRLNSAADRSDKAMEEHIQLYKKMHTQDLQLTEEFSWANEYMLKLAELNNRL